MSWQTYVDDHLMCDIEGTGQHLTAAAILGLDGTVWAKSDKFPEVIHFTVLFMFYLHSFDTMLYERLVILIV